MFRTLVSTLALLAPLPALADNFALLVGASTYTNLEERFWLTGPANDVDLVRTYLTTAAPVPFAEENVIALADGVEGAGLPTLQGIRDGFAELAGRIGPGDFVYLHFSGHGTQAPAINPETEIDGLDEMFLPIDIGPWNDTVGTVENGLVDDEIGELIGSLRATGATVWAVFDACHSGTVTRAAPAAGDDVRMRKLSPDALGVPEAALIDAEVATTRAAPGPRQRPPSPLDGGEGDGAFVAFFAAQTTEVTPEKRLPRGAPDRRSQGVFTYTIFETLAENPGVTYRQLGQEVLRKYAVQNLALSTPMFEGDLDGFVFSGEAGEPIFQWPVREGEFGLRIDAGRLQQLAEGEVLALLPTAASAVEDAIGFVEVTFLDTFEADVEPIERDGMAAVDPFDVARGTFARKIEQGVDFTLQVARPEGVVPDTVAAALAQLAEDAGARIALVEPEAEADVRLAVIPDSARPEALWLLPGTGYFTPEKADQTPSVGFGGRDAAEVAALLDDSLGSMARAINLLRMGGQYDQTDLAVDLRLQTRNRQQRELTDLDLTSVPVLVPDDQVHVLARNDEAFPVDANVLHIGSDYAISHFYNGRLQPGDTLKKGLFRITDTSFGRDRVVIILTPAEPQTPVEDLRFLAQSAVEVTRGAGDPGAKSFSAQLRNAGFGTVTRGAVSIDDNSGPAPAILQFDIDTVPGS
ncbi:MAG: caspase family protein [Pseudomonadota bacterium]